MRFSEVLLRLGAGLVAWILLLTYFIWLGVVGRLGCGPDGDELHRLVLGFAPFALIAAAMLRLTRPLTEVHGILRWGAALLGLLLFPAVAAVWSIAGSVWRSGMNLCGSGPPATWELAWPAVHGAVLLIVTVLVVLNWRSGSSHS